MAEKDASEKALEDLLAGLSAPATPSTKGPAEPAEEKKQSAASSRDAIGEKMSEVDEMAAGLQELLSSASLTEHVEAAKQEEEAKAAEEKLELEDMESALASALATPSAPATAESFDEIEETWEEPATAVAITSGDSVSAAAPVDMATLYQTPAPVTEDILVVVEPEKLSEKRKRFYAKTTLGIAAALAISYLFFYYGIQPTLRYYYFHLLVKALTEKRYNESDQLLITSESFGMTKEKYMHLSDIAMTNRDLPRSLLFARKSVNLMPNYALPLNRIAQIYLLQGRIDEAENQAKQNLVIDPNNLDAYVTLASAHFKKHDIQKAQRVISEVLSRDRNYVSALELLRDIYIELKNYNQALGLQQQLTAIKKDIPESQRLLDLGKIYYSATKYAAANAVLKEAYDKDPTLWEAGYYLAKSEHGLGQYFLAAEQIARTLKEAPSPTLDMYFLRASANYHLGDIRTTIEELQRIRIINPKYAPLYVLMGKIYVYRYGEYASGLKFLEQAKALNYADDDFYKTLGTAYFNLKRFRDAYDAWYPLLLNIQLTDPFLFQVSACLMHLNQMELAQSILLKMWSAGSRSTAIYNNLGVIHELLGRRDMALRFYFLATERAVTQGRRDSLIPKKNFDRLISGRGSLDIDESLLMQL